MRRTCFRTVLLVLPAVLCLAAPPALADDVHLTNGRAFYGVVAQVQGEKVAIRLPDGIIRLPLSHVARIERAETRLEEYVERRHALTGRRAPAADWIELALWARDQGFNTAYREAARRAADLDPQAAGLKPVMRDLGWIYDDVTDRWLDETVAMQRRGLVRYDGAWVTPAERASAMARTSEAATLRYEAEQRAQRDAAELRLERQRLERQEDADRESDAGYAAVPVVAYGVGYWGPPLVTPRHGHGGHGGGGHQGGDTAGPHPPRSHLPPPVEGSTGGHNRGGMQRHQQVQTPFRASDWLPGKLGTGAAPPPGRLGPTARPQQ